MLQGGEREVEGHGPEHDHGLVFREVQHAGEEILQNLLIGGFGFIQHYRRAKLALENILAHSIQELPDVGRRCMLQIVAELTLYGGAEFFDFQWKYLLIRTMDDSTMDDS